MLAVKHDAVLIIVNIGRILEIPVAAVDSHGNDPVVLSGRMVQPARVSLIFPAQQALGIGGLLCQLGGGNSLGILLRLGQVDGDVQISIFRRRNPLPVLYDAVAADIVRILAEFIVIIRSLQRAFLIQFPEFPDHVGGTVHQDSHHLCVKQIPVSHCIFFHETCLIGVIADLAQNLFQLSHNGLVRRIKAPDGCLCLFLQRIHAQQLQQPVGCVNAVPFLNQSCGQSILHQPGNCVLYHIHRSSFSDPPGSFYFFLSPSVIPAPHPW